MPELSIIVPVYKVEPYLRRCIDSILAQTFRDFELILIDDGSPDNCGTICDEYAAKDERIIVIHQKNQGVSAARNAGLDIATGKYVSFLDADDTFSENMFSIMTLIQKKQDVDVVICGFNSITENGMLIAESNVIERRYTKDELVTAVYSLPNPVEGVCWNKLFLRSKIDGLRYKIGMSRAEDTLFQLEYFMHIHSGYAISERLCNITQRHNSASRTETVNAMAEALTGVRQVYQSAFSLSLTKEQVSTAINYVLDQTIRFATKIKVIGKRTNVPYRLELWKAKYNMLRIIAYAYVNKLLSKAKIHGYIMGMIKL